MAQNPAYTFQPLTDSSLLIDFGGSMNMETHHKVLAAYSAIKTEYPDFILDLIPAYSSLGIIYSIEKADELPGQGSIYSRVAEWVRTRLSVTDNRKQEAGRELQVPVCYEAPFAPDLEHLARSMKLRVEDVIEIHTSVSYNVFMLGFLPGFPYMGIVDDRIAVPRRSTPRTSVPRGSVGIAGRQTGIYPFDSPGGWQLIGRTPVELFDPSAPQPTFFLPGDQVRFYPISRHEFENH